MTRAEEELLRQIDQLMPERTRDLTPEEFEKLAYWLVDRKPPEEK